MEQPSEPFFQNFIPKEHPNYEWFMLIENIILSRREENKKLKCRLNLIDQKTRKWEESKIEEDIR